MHAHGRDMQDEHFQARVSWVSSGLLQAATPVFPKPRKLEPQPQPSAHVSCNVNVNITIRIAGLCLPCTPYCIRHGTTSIIRICQRQGNIK
jgi:hypothetical protein